MSDIDEKSPDYVKWLEKEAGGSFTRLLILCIISEANKENLDAWGYGIQKRLKKITHYPEEIRDSSLYTILKRYKRQKLVTSIKKEKRVVYSLTEKGKFAMEEGCKYWNQLVKSSLVAFETLGIEMSVMNHEEEL